jgi:hypothetical protein
MCPIAAPDGRYVIEMTPVTDRSSPRLERRARRRGAQRGSIGWLSVMRILALAFADKADYCRGRLLKHSSAGSGSSNDHHPATEV